MLLAAIVTLVGAHVRTGNECLVCARIHPMSRADSAGCATKTGCLMPVVRQRPEQRGMCSQEFQKQNNLKSETFYIFGSDFSIFGIVAFSAS
jgi:hypothetical protein